MRDLLRTHSVGILSGLSLPTDGMFVIKVNISFAGPNFSTRSEAARPSQKVGPKSVDVVNAAGIPKTCL